MDIETLKKINYLQDKIERLEEELEIWNNTIKKKMNLSYCTGKYERYPEESKWLCTEMSDKLFKDIRLKIISDLNLQLETARNEFILL